MLYDQFDLMWVHLHEMPSMPLRGIRDVLEESIGVNTPAQPSSSSMRSTVRKIPKPGRGTNPNRWDVRARH